MSEIRKRYEVHVEGRESIKGHVVLPGALRLLNNEPIPVTLDYDHTNVVGMANQFERGPVVDGYASLHFHVLFKEGVCTHDEVSHLKAGLFISNVFAYDPVLQGTRAKFITDGIIREVSFYDPRPPAAKMV